MPRLLQNLLLLVVLHLVSAGSGSDHSALLQNLRKHEYAHIAVEPIPHSELRGLSEVDMAYAMAGHPDEERNHPSHMRLTLHAFGKTLDLELFKNHRLMAPRYQELRYKQNKVHERKLRHEVQNCYYHGRVRSHKGEEPSRLAIDTCKGLSGYVQAHGEVFYIKPAPTAQQLQSSSTGGANIYGRHLVYRHRDILKVPDGQCGVGSLPQNDNSGSQPTHMDEVLAHTHGTNGRNPLPRFRTQAIEVPEVLAVNDHQRFTNKVFDTEQLTLALMNTVASYYSNSADLTAGSVQVLLIAQITWTDASSNIAITPYGPNPSEVDVTQYLPDFASWFNNCGLNPYCPAASPNSNNQNGGPADNGMMISGLDFQQTVVGFAYTGAMCTSNSVSINEVTHDGNEAFDSATMAHELGHNLGMCHDPPADRTQSVCSTLSGSIDQSSCSSKVMSASSSISNPNTRFSACSNSDLAKFLGTSTSNCLSQPTVTRSYSTNAVCGNGFIEGNETCDCGVYASDCAAAPSPWTDPCCEGTTCTLKPGAACSKSQPCCKVVGSSCTITPASDGHVCRAKGSGSAQSSECDDEEVCNGVNATCPEDKFRGDGTNCAPNLLGSAASWLSENWRSLVVGGVALVALVLAYNCVCWCWQKCCGDDEEVDKRKLRRQPSRIDRVRNNFRQRRNNARSRMSGGRNVQMVDVKVATVGGIPIPAHWRMRYTRTGIPVYVNTRTGERYDFRKGPPRHNAAPQQRQQPHHHHHHQQQQQYRR